MLWSRVRRPSVMSTAGSARRSRAILAWPHDEGTSPYETASGGIGRQTRWRADVGGICQVKRDSSMVWSSVLCRLRHPRAPDGPGDGPAPRNLQQVATAGLARGAADRSVKRNKVPGVGGVIAEGGDIRRTTDWLTIARQSRTAGGPREIHRELSERTRAL
jgi:hypothetical protein